MWGRGEVQPSSERGALLPGSGAEGRKRKGSDSANQCHKHSPDRRPTAHTSPKQGACMLPPPRSLLGSSLPCSECSQLTGGKWRGKAHGVLCPGQHVAKDSWGQTEGGELRAAWEIADLGGSQAGSPRCPMHKCTHTLPCTHMHTPYTDTHTHTGFHSPPPFLQLLPSSPVSLGPSLFKKPHSTALSCFPQLAFLSCRFWSLISPNKTPRGQAPVWSLLLAYLWASVRRGSAVLGLCFLAENSGPLYLDQDANWHSLCFVFC